MFNFSFQSAISVGTAVVNKLPLTIDNRLMFSADIATPARQFREWFYIEAYQNGREQGITIWIPFAGEQRDVAFFVTQHRNSDELGYYKGKYAMQSLSHEAYKSGFNSIGVIDEDDNTITITTIEKTAKSIVDEIKKMFNNFIVE